MPLRNLIVILCVALASLACYRATEHDEALRMFQRTLGEISQNYVEKTDENKLVEAAIRGMVRELDENSDFQSPERAQELQSNLQHQFGGIGIQIDIDPTSHRLKVVSPMPGTPAFEAGLLADDRILAINDEDTLKFNIDDAKSRIRGEAGTPVKLSIERPGHSGLLSFQIPRAIIKTQSVFGDTRNPNGTWNFFLADHPEIGYIRISDFGERTVEEVRAALVELEKQGPIKSLLLDLRGNPGGLLDAAVQLCDLFVRDGTIVSLRGREGTTARIYSADGKAPYVRFPMAVLVNRLSASASEIVAACLQDHGRAVVAGERSYGKGTVQNVIALEGDHSLKLTTAHYFRPSGKNIHRKDAKNENDWGVQPNPGLEVKTSEDVIMKLMVARNQRDLRRGPAESAASPDAEPATDASLPLVDEALNKAVDHLDQALEQKKPVSKNAA
ncbi:MAG TPA: S41 family peptidase [Pirellulales bacterium]|jgi:carboxyl-terminal processing protease|nr:S41 family peptidase [Pirellulales bacterium]